MDRFWRGWRLILAGIGVAMLAILTGCVSQPLPEEGGLESAVPLTNTYWKLQEVAGDRVSETGAASEAHLILRDDGVANGFGGCNAFRGEYEVIDHRNLVFSRMGSTRRACQGEGDLEQALFEAMKNTAGVQMDGYRLQLLDADGDELAEFEAINQP
ncbi:META domain-containing protein [Marinobacter sp.]|uniref:META domain-containing protein n=1 Tax=Marinobacter sp. TaxID=50741 RepID=UPI0034A471CB